MKRLIYLSFLWVSWVGLLLPPLKSFTLQITEWWVIGFLPNFTNPTHPLINFIYWFISCWLLMNSGIVYWLMKEMRWDGIEWRNGWELDDKLITHCGVIKRNEISFMEQPAQFNHSSINSIKFKKVNFLSLIPFNWFMDELIEWKKKKRKEREEKCCLFFVWLLGYEPEAPLRRWIPFHNQLFDCFISSALPFINCWRRERAAPINQLINN